MTNFTGMRRLFLISVINLTLICARAPLRATDASASFDIDSYSKSVTTEIESNPTLTETVEFNDEIVLAGNANGAVYDFTLRGRCLLIDAGSGTSGCRVAVDVNLEFPDGIPSSIASSGTSHAEYLADLGLSGGKSGPAFPFDYDVMQRAQRNAGMLVVAIDSSTSIDGNTASLVADMEASHVIGRESTNATIQLLVRFPVTVHKDTKVRLRGSLKSGIRGRSQAFPILPSAPNTFTGGATGAWFDPPMATGFEFTMTGPSLFTKILSFPRAIDGDGIFRVWSENQLLGSFGEDQSVDFQALLGHSVRNFRVTGINPTVDSENETAFPIQLQFDSTHADFTMMPIPAPFISLSEPVAGQFDVFFDGTLQTSSDLRSWVSVPQAASPYKVSILPGAPLFFRAIKPD
ncbi:MAG: hypothetical protein EOP86_09735 [Verrucomicrobiaceae bacterium]|nr:MAG: hypothetical protein EOP86_09735 [Verrucomicrobiaceae bacterium]